MPTMTPGSQAVTSTPTVVWFPPTATSTRYLAISRGSTATPEPRLEHGQPIFRDDFNDLQHWITPKSTEGKVSLGINEISLTVYQPRAYLYSLLQDFSAGDYYLEVSANPTICRSSDEYGVLLRVSSAQDLFRFALTCDGRARLDRVLKGQASASNPPLLSGAIPPGAPSTSRLAVWVKGNELRFYANGRSLFGVKDSSLQGGTIGVFVRAGSDDSMTVNFFDLIIYSLDQ